MDSDKDQIEYLKGLLKRIVAPTGVNIMEVTADQNDATIEAKRYLETGEVPTHG